MNEKFIRTEMLLGSESMEILKNSTVAVFGVGGVGGFTVEALGRSGVGKLIIVDYDTVSESNINRQIIATVDTIGRSKVEVLKERLLSINPDITVDAKNILANEDNIDELLSDDMDYVVDAIDMVSSKLLLIEKCKERDIDIISAMGAGNKINPSMLEVTDVHKTSMCPLAKVMRKELRIRNIKKLKVVYSKEKPIEKKIDIDEPGKIKKTPGSTSFVPPVSGLIIASEVVKDLIDWESE